MVVPIGKVAGALFVTVTVPSTKSVALAVPRGTFVRILVASIEMLGGGEMVGAVVSVMVMVCVAVAVLPARSVAV